MIDKVITHFEEKRKYLVRDLALINRMKQEINSYNKDVRDKMVKRLRTQIREYDEHLSYLGGMKNEIQRIESRRN